LQREQGIPRAPQVHELRAAPLFQGRFWWASHTHPVSSQLLQLKIIFDPSEVNGLSGALVPRGWHPSKTQHQIWRVRRMDLALWLRQFLVKVPLVAMPAKLIHGSLGNSGSLVFGQGQAQPRLGSSTSFCVSSRRSVLLWPKPKPIECRSL
jgi:hypothetical protein